MSRKKNESIVIDDSVVTVVEIRDDKVRLGVTAPGGTVVHRQELVEAMNLSPTIPSETEQLKRLLSEVCAQRDRYCETIAALLQEDWKDVTLADLPKIPGPHSRIDDIIADLERVQ